MKLNKHAKLQFEVERRLPQTFLMSFATAPETHGPNHNWVQSDSYMPGSNAHLLVRNAEEKGKVHIACVEWYVAKCLIDHIHHSFSSN